MSVFIRILLRYVAAFLVAKGFLSPEAGNLIATDPDFSIALEILVGCGVAVAVELWYVIAVRMGWKE